MADQYFECYNRGYLSKYCKVLASAWACGRGCMKFQRTVPSSFFVYMSQKENIQYFLVILQTE